MKIMKNVVIYSILAAANIILSYKTGCLIGEGLAYSLIDLLDRKA
jgi:hypothetical protein